MIKFKKILILLLITLVNIVPVKASTKTFERTESNNYGINKKLPHPNKEIAKTIPYVDASEKIYDYADILTKEEEKELYNNIKEFIETTHMDMIFVSIDEKFSHKNVEDFICDFYDYNDFGIDFKNYSGIALIRNNNTYADGKKYYYIATTGFAKKYYADDGRLNDILDAIYDDFVSENYFNGIKQFVNKSTLYYKEQSEKFYIDDNGDLRKKFEPSYLLCGLGTSLITLVTMLVLVKKNKMVRKATTAQQYLDKDSINYSVMKDQFIRSHTTHYTTSSSSGGGSHGGSSGFSHGGGGRSG